MKKPKATLAEAIDMGHEFGPLVVARKVKVVTRALQALKKLPPNLDDNKGFSPEQLDTLGHEDQTLERLYPWLKQKQVCPWCAEEIDGANVVLHPFAKHVCSEETTVKEQLQWLQHMEEELDPLVSVAINFSTPDERLAVLWAAQRQGLTLNEFLAAAVRMVLQHRLLITDFACPDPPPTGEVRK